MTGVPRARTRRRRRAYAPAPARWVSVNPSTSLSDVLARIDDSDRRVYMVGERPGGGAAGLEEWVLSSSLPDGWTAGKHYLDSARQPVMRFVRDGRAVEVHRAATWFGEGSYTTDQARAATDALTIAMQALWDDGICPLATPATTGRELLLRSLPFDLDLPVLPDDTQQLIRATSGQGRWELHAHDGDLPGLFGYDMRFGYAALLRNIGGHLVDHDDGPYVPYQRGRYHVTFQPPAAWPWHGILPVHADQGQWSYPTDGRHSTWCDSAELHVALQHGWDVTVHERMLFADADPLRGWQDKLTTIYTHSVRAARHVADGAAEQIAVSQLVRAAARSMLLHTIGSLHGRPRTLTRTVPTARSREVPKGARDLRRVAGQLVWRETADQSAWAELRRPEWSAAVWGKCRARMASHGNDRDGRRGILHTTGRVIAVRTDAIYTDQPQPGWVDDGKIGTLRPTVAIERPVPAPARQTDLLRMIRG